MVDVADNEADDDDVVRVDVRVAAVDDLGVAAGAAVGFLADIVEAAFAVADVGRVVGLGATLSVDAAFVDAFPSPEPFGVEIGGMTYSWN